MMDEAKIKRLRFVVGGIVVCLLILFSFGLGQMTGSPKKVKEQKNVPTSSQEQLLTYQYVEEFLTAYYTKKDLGTNRNRYKPFMTQGLYNQEVAKEEEPVTQTYKGYVVDFEFQEADIYINTKTNIAIVQVDYTNTLLERRGQYDNAQKNVRNQAILKLTYVVEADGQLKLNNLQPATLVLTGEEAPDLPDYGAIGNTQKGEE